MKPKYFCHEIEHNLSVWAHNDSVSYTPCSYNRELSYGNTTNIVDSTKIWKNNKHIQTKQNIKNNAEIFGCGACYNAEYEGNSSRRTAVESMYENFLDLDEDKESFVSLEFSVGNLCNLKCLICGPENSSAWFPDYKKLFPHVTIDHLQYNKNKKINLQESIIHGNIKRLHFHGGGEPLLSDYHLDVLKLLKKQNKLSNLYVFYNTNGTKKVSQEVLDIWAECKFVELYFSIDDIGERLEYQRPGLVWNELESNLMWFKDNMPVNHMFKINCVYSYLNFFYLDELHLWYEKFFKTNRLGDNTEFLLQKVHGNLQYNLELSKLTEKQYNKVKEKFISNKILLRLLSSIKVDDEANHQDFFNIINHFDSIKTKKYGHLHHQWIELLRN